MRTLLVLLLLAIVRPVVQASGSAPRDLEDALAARSMLSADTWARIVRLDNSHPRGAWRERYPKTVYALVFEVSGILWLYTDTEGTQSLSRNLGTVARDEADPGPLFLAIDPGISNWKWVDAAPERPGRKEVEPPNACFIESVRALDRRLAAGFRTESPRLLFYYVDTRIGRLGHTVLLFGTGKGLSVINFQESEMPVPVPAYAANDPRSIAEFVRRAPVSAARTLPISQVGRPTPAKWATVRASSGAPG